MRRAALVVAAVLAASWTAHAADFATPGGREPAGLDEVLGMLAREPHDLELLISFGTSKGGSAGHLALALRQAGGTETVHSANFYADRSDKHAQGYYNAELMTRIPKREYLFGTRSSLAETAAFGLDYGEVYKRSVVGIRVRGVPEAERDALSAYYARMNDDFRRRAPRAEYHDEEIKYDYMRLNCAKTIGAGFRFGAGYSNLEVKQAHLFSGRRIVAAATANIPTEMALKLMKEWDARGYAMDVVLYKKYEGSPYVDPHEEERVAFGNLPNRFPSVLSLDFGNDQGEYEDYDNLFAMYLLYNLGRYSVRIERERVEIEAAKEPMPYPAAAGLAAKNAEADSRSFLRRLPFIPKGLRIGEPVSNRPQHQNDGAGSR